MAASEYTVQAVSEYWPNPDTPCWAVDMTKPDGGSHRHVFPKHTLEQRAAEYGIEPTAVEDLLDIVLHEPYAPHPDDPDSDDPAAAAGLVSPALVSRGATRKGDLIPTTLYTAPDAATALAAHRTRIDYAKTKRVRVAPPKNGKDPLDIIRGNHDIDPARVAAKAQTINHRRLVAQGRAQATPAIPNVARKDEPHRA
jgi:hypothetical protein